MAKDVFMCEYPELKAFLLANVQFTGTRIGVGDNSVVEFSLLGAAAKRIVHDPALNAARDEDAAFRKSSEEFVKQCQLLATLRHPNVVQFLGITHFPGSRLPAVVTERLLTSLHDLLVPDSPLQSDSLTPLSFFSMALKCAVLHDVASGLAYLHEQSPPVIHRNLTAKNILLDSQMVAKISDFGIVCTVEEARKADLKIKAPGRLIYSPPEALECTQESTCFDVFSFGVVTIFTIGGTYPCDLLDPTYINEESGLLEPRNELQRRSKCMRCVNDQLRACGQLQEHLDHPLIRLIEKCLHNLPAKRPGIREVLHLLKEARVGVRDEESERNKCELVKALQTQLRNKKLEHFTQDLVTENSYVDKSKLKMWNQQDKLLGDAKQEQHKKTREGKRKEVFSKEHEKILLKKEHLQQKIAEEEMKMKRLMQKNEQLELEWKTSTIKLQQAQVKANEMMNSLEGNAKAVTQVKNELMKSNFIAQKTVQVTNEEQNIIWEDFGLRLHIPQNSLPEGCSLVQLKMIVLRTKDYRLPAKDGILVSPVYSLSHGLGEKKFKKRVTLELQHSASGSSVRCLQIVRSDGYHPPYEFNIVPDSKFDDTDSYGSIELDHFCIFSVMWCLLDFFLPPLRFCAVLYYTDIKPQSFKFYLYIIERVDAYLKVIDHDVKEKTNNYFKRGPVSPLVLDENLAAIHLFLPKAPVLGWTMKHLNADKMNFGDIIRNEGIIPFQVCVNGADRNGELLKKLEYELVVTGTKGLKMLIISPDECTEFERGGSNIPQRSTLSDKDFLEFPEPKLAHVMEIVGVHVQDKWRSIGLQLGIKQRELDIIQQSQKGSVTITQDCMTEVFARWRDNRTSEYSWRMLAKVMCSSLVKMQGLLPRIHSELLHLTMSE